MVRTRDALELLAGIFFYGWLTVTTPAFILYGLGAAENNVNLVKFFLFAILPLWVLIARIGIIYLQNRGWFEQNPEYGGLQYFSFHNPEYTFIGKHLPAIQKPLAMISVFLVFGAFLGYVMGVSGSFATGVPILVEGSISDGASLALAVEPAVSSETMFFNVGLFWVFFALIYYVLAKRGADPKLSVIFAKLVAVVANTIAFWIYHFFRYGNQETSQIGVLLLGFITNVSTAATNSVIPAYLIHGSGNLFNKAIGEGIWGQGEATIAAASMAIIGVIGILLFLVRPMMKGEVEAA